MVYVPGKGSLLQTTQLTSSTTTFVSIAQVTSITPPQLAMGSVETTHLTSTWREHQSTIKDGGEVAFALEWDPAHITHSEALTHWSTGTARTWRVVYSTTANTTTVYYHEFAGFPTAFQFQELTVDNVALVNMTIRTTSAVTLASS